MSLQDLLYPFGGNHAIQSAVFALEWAEPLTPDLVKKLREVLKPLRADFPGPEQTQQKLTVNLGSGAHQVHTDEGSGFILTRPGVSVASPSRSLIIEEKRCIIQIADYTRWKDAKADVDRYLDLVFPEIAKSRPINVIGLQYVDAFRWKGSPSSMPVVDILKKSSKYLSPNVFELKELWHSHHGYFETCHEPREAKQLDNVNVNKIEDEGVASLQILTSHRAQFPLPIWANEGDARHVVNVTYERMHDRNKAILADLLTDEVQHMIKLNPLKS